MTFTVAFLILALGIAIGMRIRPPLERLIALYRRRTYKPALLRPALAETDMAATSRPDAR